MVGDILVHIAEGVAAHFIVEWLVGKLSRSAKFVRYKGKTYEINKQDMARLVSVLQGKDES